MRTKYVLNLIDSSSTVNASIAMFWLLLPMRQLFKVESFNIVPKSETVTECYKSIVPFVKKVHAEWGHKPMGEVTLRQVFD